MQKKKELYTIEACRHCFQLTAFYFNRQLQEIQSKANSPGIGIGSLTGEKRDTWHEVGKLS